MSNSNGEGRFWSAEDYEFFRHTAKNVLIFLSIAAVALCLNFFHNFLKNNFDVSVVVLYAILVVEYTLLIFDVIWFVCKIAIDTYRSILTIARNPAKTFAREKEETKDMSAEQGS